MTRPAIHPGEHIADELEALDMSASILGRNLGIPINWMTETSPSSPDEQGPVLNRV
jgi:plasmid maintenance system antidote protein VapI